MNKDFLKARVNGLKSISNALSNINIPHVIFDGALLGFIRERNLISWDWDAEIALHYRYFNANILKIIEVLEKCNLGKVIFKPSKKNPKLTIKLSKSEFGDFKYVITPYKLSKDSKNIYRELYHYPSKYLNELSKIEIDNFYFPIPKDYESLLKLQYGVNWKVPKRSNVKNDYLSNEVYTKSNNQINQFKTYILQVISKIINLSKNKIKNFLNKYPAFQYKFNMHREQLFIYQLASLINQNQYSKVIEIGSSDLSEYITLKSCFKNESFSDFIYEGL